jgi:hypothetical protein
LKYRTASTFGTRRRWLGGKRAFPQQKPADFPLILEAQLPLIRAAVKRAKTSTACTPAIQWQLDWVGDAQNNDPESSPPVLTRGEADKSWKVGSGGADRRERCACHLRRAL